MSTPDEQPTDEPEPEQPIQPIEQYLADQAQRDANQAADYHEGFRW
ncbi:hypothetical protein VSR01_10960 [Actinacidiphila sp. DG2A-62]|nr:hypothetical protein [Actinacidiphila sp. DG2A-62]MEC3994039.1 hypothetical protein [Actinacidiphila sp. DG2A-62]